MDCARGRRWPHHRRSWRKLLLAGWMSIGVLAAVAARDARRAPLEERSDCAWSGPRGRPQKRLHRNWAGPRQFDEPQPPARRHQTSTAVPAEDGEPVALTWKELRAKKGIKGGDWRPYLSAHTDSHRLQKRLSHARSIEDVSQEVLQSSLPLSEWAPLSLATAWHRLARASSQTRGPRSVREEDAIERLAGALTEDVVSEFGPKEISGVMYAWALLNFKNTPLLQLVYRRILDDADRYDPQGIANIFYALSHLKIPASSEIVSEVLEALCNVAVQRLPEFGTQEIAMTVHAMGRLEFMHKELLSAVCRDLTIRVDHLSPHEVASVLNGLRWLKFRNFRLLEAICDTVPPKLSYFEARHIANIAYAMGKFKVQNEEFTEALTRHVAVRYKEFYHQDPRRNALPGVMKSLKVLRAAQDESLQ